MFRFYKFTFKDGSFRTLGWNCQNNDEPMSLIDLLLHFFMTDENTLNEVIKIELIDNAVIADELISGADIKVSY